MFESLLLELNTSIEMRGGESSELPNDIRSFRGKRGNCLITNWLWQVPGFRRWRVTNLNAGDNLQVLNSVAYPDYDNDQPIMGIDLLWFGTKKKLVAVLDFQPLVQNKEYFGRHYDGLISLNSKFPELCKNTSMHSFDPKQYFSPWLLFCRGGIEEARFSLPRAFNEFLKCYWDLHNQMTNRAPKLSPEEVRRLQMDYDTYSYQRDPAHGLFASYFGKSWTNKFVRSFLFPDSQVDELNFYKSSKLK